MARDWQNGLIWCRRPRRWSLYIFSRTRHQDTHVLVSSAVSHTPGTDSVALHTITMSTIDELLDKYKRTPFTKGLLPFVPTVEALTTDFAKISAKPDGRQRWVVRLSVVCGDSRLVSYGCRYATNSRASRPCSVMPQFMQRERHRRRETTSLMIRKSLEG